MKNPPLEKHFLELTDSQEYISNRGAKALERIGASAVPALIARRASIRNGTSPASQRRESF